VLAAVDVNDLSRLKAGRDGVQYLLDNWDTATVDENSGDDTPDKVRFYVGLKTTDHPLFQVDKLLNKAQDKLPDDVDFEEWVAAVEGLQSAIAKVNELSYTASFGEYNPGGGKAQVRKFLLLAKEQVVVTKDTLDTMIKLLKL
jgi:Ca2+ transporting ATPase